LHLNKKKTRIEASYNFVIVKILIYSLLSKSIFKNGHSKEFNP